MKELYTEIEIQASPERVWQALTDLEHCFAVESLYSQRQR